MISNTIETVTSSHTMHKTFIRPRTTHINNELRSINIGKSFQDKNE